MNRRRASRLLLAAIPFLLLGVSVLVAYATALAQSGGPTLSFTETTLTAVETQGSVTISVTLANPPQGQDVTVQYATADGTATSPADYANTSGTLTFPAGAPLLMQTITIPIVNDGIADSGEIFTVNLSNAQNATIDATKSTCTITINDTGGGGPGDPTLPMIAFSSANFSVAEEGTATITVNLSGPSSKTVTVAYATATDTGASAPATAGVDYTATSGTLTLEPNQTSKTFTVTTLHDCRVEGDETVQLVLSSPTNAIVGVPNPATLTITDATPAPPPVNVSATGGTFAPDPAPIENMVSTILSAQAQRPDPGSGCTLNSPSWSWTFVKAESSDVSEAGPWTEAQTGFSYSITPASSPPPDASTDYSTVNLSATFSVAAYWRITLKCAVSYTNCCGQPFEGDGQAAGNGAEFKVIIKRSRQGTGPWETIEDPMNPSVKYLLPGACVKLKADLQPPVGNINFQWAKPPATSFKEYNINAMPCEVTDLAAADLKAQELTFYWADPGDKVVTCTATNGANMADTRSATIVVDAVTVAFTATQGKVRWLTEVEPTKIFGLFGPVKAGVDGMVFSASVNVPQEYATGKWEYAQTVNMRHFRTNDGKKQHGDINGLTVLDFAVPYPESYDKDGKKVANFDTGIDPGKAIDSPYVKPGAKTTMYSRDDSFITYIMFKPAGDNAKWVPVKQMWWWWTATATLSDGTWTLSGADQGPTPPTSMSPSSLPVWRQAFTGDFNWLDD